MCTESVKFKSMTNEPSAKNLVTLTEASLLVSSDTVCRRFGYCITSCCRASDLSGFLAAATTMVPSCFIRPVTRPRPNPRLAPLTKYTFCVPEVTTVSTAAVLFQ